MKKYTIRTAGKLKNKFIRFVRQCSGRPTVIIALCAALMCVLCACGDRFEDERVAEYVCTYLDKSEDEVENKDLENIGELYLYDVHSVNDLPKFKNLKELSVTDSDVESWKPLYSLNLSTLKLWNNSGELDFAQIDKADLETLEITGNDVLNLESLAEAANLKSLTVSNVENTDFSFVGNLKNLEYLELSGCGIEDISFVDGLHNLKSLSLGENLISDLSPLKNHMSLESLDLHHNRIGDVSALENIIDLQVLDLSENSVTDLSPIKNLTGLYDLDVSNNGITDISPLKTLRFLQSVNLSSNYIKTLAPIESLESLSEITANNNFITTVPAKLFKNIGYMDLSSNSLRISNASVFVWLEQNKGSSGGINLFDNPLTESDITALDKIDSVSFLSGGLPVSAQSYIQYNSVINEIVNGANVPDEREKAYSIYTSLANGCVKSQTESLESSLGAFNVVVNKKGTSLDCANALSSALRRVGIRSAVYCGDRFGNEQTDMKHYWNIVYIGEKRVYCDLYCDLGYLSSPSFFGVNDDYMTDNEHIMLDDYRGSVDDMLA